MRKILSLILLLGLFFRVYKLEAFYPFGHDQDLYSWIVKDILVDGHLRLIGQLTSIDGIFVGPLFYYVLVPFYALFNLNPLAATIPATLIGLLTIFSFYFCLSRIYSKEVGAVAAFLYAISITNAFFDRWVVPTQPTILWSIWYLYLNLELARGNFRVLPIFGILLGLIWHIHIALIPLMALIPIAILLSKRKFVITKKDLVKKLFLSVLVFVILMLPFVLFEARHGYQQTFALINSITEDRKEPQGFYRLQEILKHAAGPISGNLVLYLQVDKYIKWIPLVVLLLFLSFKKILARRDLIIFIGWIFLVILGQFISKRNLTEYYFSNLTPIFITLFSLFLGYFYLKARVVIFIFLGLFFIINFINLVNLKEPSNGFIKQKELVSFISKDARGKNFPCISVNYISDFGRGVGFYYLLWLSGLKVIEAGKGAPVYNIVYPLEYAINDIEFKFGSYGLIMPKEKGVRDAKICDDPDSQVRLIYGFTK